MIQSGGKEKTRASHILQRPQLPTSKITSQERQYNKLESIEFDGSLSHDNDNIDLGYQPKWEWDFNYHASAGFNVDMTSSSTYVYRTYPQPGTYYVALRYWDNDGQYGNIDTIKITITDSGIKTDVVYSYNRANQIVTMSYPSVDGSPKLVHTYDNRGRLSYLSDDNTGSYLEDLGYEDNGNVDFQDIYCAYNGTGLESVHNYQYDGMDRLVQVSKPEVNQELAIDQSTILQPTITEAFQYDNDGNITSKMNWRGTFQYSYNSGSNKLISLYGNRTTYNFGYDYRGNLTNDYARKQTYLEYNYRNLPKTIRKEISPSITDIFNYRYDDNGNRIYKEINVSNGITEKEYYLRDQTGKEIAVYDVETQKLKMVNLYGNDMIGRVNVSSSTAQGTDPTTGQPSQYATANYDRYYYIKDHLGSIVAALDKDCNSVNSQAYSAYGEYLPGTPQSTGGIENEKYKFTGKERDNETNYDYFGARLYDSELGRWLQVDPLVEMYPGWSPYNYCKDNPLRIIDPTGMLASESKDNVKVYFDDNRPAVIGHNILPPAGYHVEHWTNDYISYKPNDSKEVERLQNNQMHASLTELFKTCLGPISSLHDMLMDPKTNVPDAVKTILEEFNKRGIASTPLVTSLVNSLVNVWKLAPATQLFLDDNPFTPNYNYVVKPTQGVDSIFYDVTKGNDILQVDHNRYNSNKPFWSEHFGY